MARPDIDNSCSAGDSGPQIGEESLGEVFSVDDDMEVGVPLLTFAVVGDFKGIDTAGDSGFPIDRPSEVGEGSFELEDLALEVSIVADRGEGDKFRGVEGGDEGEDSNENCPRSGLGAEGAESGFATSLGDPDFIVVGIDDDDRGRAARVEAFVEAGGNVTVLELLQGLVPENRVEEGEEELIPNQMSRAESVSGVGFERRWVEHGGKPMRRLHGYF
ncbi:hypothetical protein LCGC14_1164200 [marine sediment metagenome]|uniref:Uncharacterized protein n=1 Tax=marine sediment metagenome TaxID=412755 RepID=A0A0F9MES3_9ZZZZ